MIRGNLVLAEAGRFTLAVFDSCVAGEVQNELAVLFKRVTAENLGVEVGRIKLARNVTDGDHARATQLAHLV